MGTPSPHFDKTLPIELHYAIIDLLYLDAQSLARCSTVCTHWRIRSHKHTFAKVDLTWSSVLLFRTLIQNEFTASAVIPSVRGLHVQGPPISLPAWDRNKMAAISEILAVLSASGNITDFSLQNLVWAALAHDSLPLNLSGLSTVSTLELLQISFSTRVELIVFLDNFQNLRHLVLQDVECVTHPSPSSLPFNIPSGSYGLALRCPEDFSLRKRLRWERQTPTVSAAELADLTILVSKRHRVVSDILHAFGHSLHRLQLATETIHTYPDAALHQLDLSQTTSLKQLSLGSSKRVLSLLPWVPLILTQLPATEHPALTHLQFAFASSRQFHLDRPILLIIADVLTRSQFRELQTIHFTIFDATGDRELMKIVRHTICEAFGSWYRKGVLAFSFLRS